MKAGMKRGVASLPCLVSSVNYINYTCLLPFAKKCDVKCTHSSSGSSCFSHVEIILCVFIKHLQTLTLGHLRSLYIKISLYNEIPMYQFICYFGLQLQALVLVLYIPDYLLFTAWGFG